jgi:hypothetical protein
MPPHSACDEQQIGLLGYSQHSSDGIPRATSHQVLGVPKPLTTEHDEQPVLKKAVLKKVFFSNQNLIRSTLHISDYTEEEIESAWLRETDYANIKAEMRLAIALVHAGIVLGEEETISYCYRGLECRTKKGSRRKMFNKIIARDAVLDEQDRQDDSFMTADSEAIAKVYIAASHPSQVSARTKGMSDEKDASWRLPRSILPQII